MAAFWNTGTLDPTPMVMPWAAAPAASEFITEEIAPSLRRTCALTPFRIMAVEEAA